MSIDLILLLVGFTIACAYFNHRSGYKQGLIEGMESTLKLLEATGHITVEKNPTTGDAKITKVKVVDVENKT